MELQLDDRTTGELDTFVHPMNREEAETDDDPRDGEDRRLFPVANEVVFRAVKNA